MKEIASNAKRAKRKGKDAEDRAYEIGERFLLGQRVAFHPAATQRGGEPEAGAKHSAEQPVGQRAIKKHASAGRACRGQRDDDGLSQAHENPAKSSSAEPHDETANRVRPRLAGSLGDRLARQLFAVVVFDSNLGVVARLAQQKNHAAKRGDEHLASKSEGGNQDRDREWQPNGGRGVQCNRRSLAKTDSVDRCRNECGKNLQRRGEEHLPDAQLDAERACCANVDQVVEGMCAHAECGGLNQKAGLASVRANGVDQGLNACADALGKEAREEEKELWLREEREAHHDDRQEDGVHQEHAVGADEPHPEDARRHDDHTEGKLAEDHLDTDRGRRAGGLTGVLRDVVDTPATKARETARGEGTPETRDHDRAAEESPFGEDPLAHEQPLPSDGAEADRNELHQHGGHDPAPVQVAQSREQVFCTIPAEDLPEDERQHPDGENQLQNEEGDSFGCCAHVPSGLS